MASQSLPVRLVDVTETGDLDRWVEYRNDLRNVRLSLGFPTLDRALGNHWTAGTAARGRFTLIGAQPGIGRASLLAHAALAAATDAVNLFGPNAKIAVALTDTGRKRFENELQVLDGQPNSHLAENIELISVHSCEDLADYACQTTIAAARRNAGQDETAWVRGPELIARLPVAVLIEDLAFLVPHLGERALAMADLLLALARWDLERLNAHVSYTALQELTGQQLPENLGLSWHEVAVVGITSQRRIQHHASSALDAAGPLPLVAAANDVLMIAETNIDEVIDPQPDETVIDVRVTKSRDGALPGPIKLRRVDVGAFPLFREFRSSDMYCHPTESTPTRQRLVAPDQ